MGSQQVRVAGGVAATAGTAPAPLGASGGAQAENGLVPATTVVGAAQLIVLIDNANGAFETADHAAGYGPHIGVQQRAKHNGAWSTTQIG